MANITGVEPAVAHQLRRCKRVFTVDWRHTGDVGYLDSEGYFYFLERQKDMLKRSGFNVAAAAVERVLMDQPSAHEAAWSVA